MLQAGMEVDQSHRPRCHRRQNEWSRLQANAKQILPSSAAATFPLQIRGTLPSRRDRVVQTPTASTTKIPQEIQRGTGFLRGPPRPTIGAQWKSSIDYAHNQT